MALLRLEGFEFGSPSSDITSFVAQRYSVIGPGPFQVVSGRYSGFKLRAQGFYDYKAGYGSNKIRMDIGKNVTGTLFFGFHFSAPNKDYYDSEVIRIYNSSNAQVLTLSPNLIYWTGTGSSIQFTTSAYNRPSDVADVYIEFALTIGSASSTLMRVNGTEYSSPFISGASSYNAIANFRYIEFCFASPTYYTYFDDIYVADSSTGRITTFIPGAYRSTIRVNSISSDGDYTQWTPYSGTVQRSPLIEAANNDSTYVKSEAIGLRDSFPSSLVNTGKPIHGVQLNTRARKLQAEASALRVFHRQSGVDTETGDIALADAFATYPVVYDANPRTGAQFVSSDFGSGQQEFGFKTQS